ncbi:uncharacterized protein LOC128712346 [Anopheles marshallii]|uniref:uncharacterized protein LOC128712346 n=1 Tax=Anopheles marshallii TaxID=1521116 RepID=UPI00237AC045|nr:uncharacterized protein LOC128712346 [Anopheles marshallii]
MNINVSDLTDIALQIMGYKMYDPNGIPVDALDAIVKYQPAKENTGKAKSAKRKVSNTPTQTQEQFLVQFGLPNFDTVLENPKQYVESQMATFSQQQQERLVTMRTEDDVVKSSLKTLRAAIGRQVAREKPVLTHKMNKIYSALCQADKAELLARTQYDVNVADHVLLKQGILLHEFNMLLQLLKQIMEDLSDNYSHYDFAFYLLQKLYEQM